MKRILTAVLIILFSAIINGRDVLLNIYAPGAAGKMVQVYNQPDPIMAGNTLLTEILVPDNEMLSLNIDCNDICWLRIRYGVYDLLLVVSEGETYEFELPYYKALTQSDRLNPFFKYRFSHIKVPGDNNINNTIRYIDSLFFQYSGMITRSIYLGEVVDDKEYLLESFAGIEKMLTGDYTLKYFNYRQCLLKMIFRKQRQPGREDIELMNKEYLPLMPAFTDLVNQVYNGYLRRLASDSRTDSLRVYINYGGSYDNIFKLIHRQGTIRDTALLEFVILSNLYNEYYMGGFRKKAIENIFIHMSGNATDKYNRNLAYVITEKINRLKPGNITPGFMLRNRKGETYTLDSLSGKFTILVFGAMGLPETKAELVILFSWAHEYSDELNIVIILLDEDFESSLAELDYNNQNYLFLDGSESSTLIHDYDIRYIPTFYFLDREMRLIQSPAILPSENLRRLVVPKLGSGIINDIRD